MLPFRYLAAFTLLALAAAQDYDYQAQGPARPAPARIQPGYSGPAQPKPTPVAILKQINRHNEDGSYTYGYEGADGSFKIETKLPTGEVKGKYGYVDDTGKVRVVEYGATKYGFEPSGEGITVAPPTLVDETTNKDGLQIQQQDEYVQYEQPQPQRQRVSAPAPRPRPSFESFGPQRSAAPIPPRAVVPGAQQLSTNFEYVPQTRPQPVRTYAPVRQPQPSYSYAQPAPIEEDNYEEPTQRPAITYAQPRPQPQYQPQYSAPAATQAITRPQPQYAPRPQPIQQGRPSGGVLDQLAKDYALPSGGAAPLHDISFGYY